MGFKPPVPIHRNLHVQIGEIMATLKETLRAIRLKCTDCCAGSTDEVDKCKITGKMVLGTVLYTLLDLAKIPIHPRPGQNSPGN